MLKSGKLKVGILISGRGSNMQALIDAAKDAKYPAQIAIVISNKDDAAGLQRAQASAINTAVISHKDYASREQFEQALDAKLREAGVELVCLAGFMRVLTSLFVSAWNGKLINIHPSLLPAFPGLDTHRQAIEAKAKMSGCTVHYVNEGMDTGPIIAQAPVPVFPTDTEDKLAARVLEVEHRLYPQVVRFIAEGKVGLKDGTVWADPSLDWPAPVASRVG